MRRLLPMGIAAAILLASFSPVAAAPAHHNHPQARPPAIAVTFRLRVSGTPDAEVTFWVAYGPLAGRFGLVQLHAACRGLYAAVDHLPAHSRTTFAYLEAQSTVQTRFGTAPGSPTVTIRRIGPVAVTGTHLPVVHWQMPVG